MTDMGPIDYLIVEFPADRQTGEGLPMLVDLVERGVIRLLDLVFIRRNHDDSVVGIALTVLDGDRHLDLTVFQGASSGLVDEDDIGQAAAALEPGGSAAILIYENLWAAPLAAALQQGGAELVAGGQIPYSVVEDTLDALDR
jgi:hypothetical protein